MLPQEVTQSPLFFGIKESDFSQMLSCLGAVRRQYPKDSFVFQAGSKVSSVGIVLSGSVYVIQEDYWGGRILLASAKEGGLFAAAFSCVESENLPVSVLTTEASEILLIDTRKLLGNCASGRNFHTQLIRNMLGILAGNNIMLTQKITLLSKRTTREKLLSFLSAQSAQAGSPVVELPFNRQDLADYLCVDRSALSRELSAMQRDGLLRYNKNQFELLRPMP